MRLVKGWEVDETLPQPGHAAISVKWFESALNNALQNFTSLYEDYRLSEALMAIYKLIWDDFCSWYLELVKPGYQQPVDKKTMEATLGFFTRLLQELHPFMPFITEEIWHLLKERDAHESIMITRLAAPVDFDEKILKKFEYAEEVIIAIRNLRKEHNISFRDPIRLMIRKNNDETSDTTFDEVVMKLCGISELTYVTEKQEGVATVIVRTTDFYVPLTGNVNKEEEIRKITEELAYYNGFLAKVEKQLSNANFVDHAPAKVVEGERKKQSDAQARIRVLEEQLRELNK